MIDTATNTLLDQAVRMAYSRGRWQGICKGIDDVEQYGWNAQDKGRPPIASGSFMHEKLGDILADFHISGELNVIESNWLLGLQAGWEAIVPKKRGQYDKY